MGRGNVKYFLVSFVTLAVAACMSRAGSSMTSTLVTLAMVASLGAEVLELEEACGVLLQVKICFHQIRQAC